MATVTFDGTRVNGAGDGNSTSGFTSWGASVTAEPDYYYTNSYCISVLVKTSEVGFYCTGASTVDFSSPVRVWLAKIIQTNYTAIDGNGLQLCLGNDTSNYWNYPIFSATTYPALGGFQIVPIDPNVSSGVTRTPVGSPSITAIDFYGVLSDANAQAKAPNLGMDAVDYITSGTGLTLSGTSGTFTDFITFDENTNTNRYGIVTTKEGIIYVVGVLTIGNPVAACTFAGANRTIVFPSGRFGTGFCGIDLNLGHASTVISLTNITLIGRGTSGTFDTRPDFGVTNTSGSATIDTCAYTNFNSIVFTSKVTITDSNFVSCQTITQAGATISGSIFDSSPVATNTAFMTVSDISKISSSTFISGGTGHAIELTSAHSASPTEYTLSGVTFSGYSGTTGSNLTPSSGSSEAAIYNNSGKHLIINITGGVASPSVRNAASSTTTINNNVSVTVTIKDQAGNPIPGVEVAIFQDNPSRTVVLASTQTNASGEVTTSAAASLGAIIIRARQSTKIASFVTNSGGVNTSTEVITTTTNHGFRTGDKITYSKNGGTYVVSSALTEGSIHYVNRQSDTTLILYDTAANAITGGATGRRDLTGNAGSETHSLDPVRYIPGSATGTIGTSAFSSQITMVTDNIASG